MVAPSMAVVPRPSPICFPSPFAPLGRRPPWRSRVRGWTSPLASPRRTELRYGASTRPMPTSRSWCRRAGATSLRRRVPATGTGRSTERSPGRRLCCRGPTAPVSELRGLRAEAKDPRTNRTSPPAMRASRWTDGMTQCRARSGSRKHSRRPARSLGVSRAGGSVGRSSLLARCMPPVPRCTGRLSRESSRTNSCRSPVSGLYDAPARRFGECCPRGTVIGNFARFMKVKTVGSPMSVSTTAFARGPDTPRWVLLLAVTVALVGLMLTSVAGPVSQSLQRPGGLGPASPSVASPSVTAPRPMSSPIAPSGPTVTSMGSPATSGALFALHPVRGTPTHPTSAGGAVAGSSGPVSSGPGPALPPSTEGAGTATHSSATVQPGSSSGGITPTRAPAAPRMTANVPQVPVSNLTGWNGINFTSSNCSCSPPDVQIAVGPRPSMR